MDKKQQYEALKAAQGALCMGGIVAGIGLLFSNWDALGAKAGEGKGKQCAAAWCGVIVVAECIFACSQFWRVYQSNGKNS
jgi:hypothetical protein